MYKPNEKITEEILNLMTYVEQEDSGDVLEIIQNIARLSFVDGGMSLASSLENEAKNNPAK